MINDNYPQYIYSGHPSSDEQLNDVFTEYHRDLWLAPSGEVRDFGWNTKGSDQAFQNSKY